jgi:hypothetical protein
MKLMTLFNSAHADPPTRDTFPHGGPFDRNKCYFGDRIPR